MEGLELKMCVSMLASRIRMVSCYVSTRAANKGSLPGD